MVSGGARTGGKVALNRGLNPLLAFGGELFLLGLAPGLAAHQVGPEPGDGLLLPARLHFFGGAIAGGIICRGVVAQPIGDGFDKTRPLAAARGRDRLLGGIAHGDDVVAVDLLAGKARSYCLLRQGLACRLELEGHRDGPLIVVDRRTPVAAFARRRSSSLRRHRPWRWRRRRAGKRQRAARLRNLKA